MKLGYTIIYVSDVKKTIDFYAKAFDMNIRLEVDDGKGCLDYGEMETTGAVLGFAAHELGKSNLDQDYVKVDESSKPIGQEIVFVVDDVAGVYQKAVESGAIAVKEPSEKPWGQTVAYLRGIEGTLIELCTPMQG